MVALPAQPRLVRQDRVYVHDIRGETVDQSLWSGLWPLATLLTSNEAARIGSCHAEGCGWLFVDESP
jgi:predicted RNA-binding Zn ribbon-like protein